MKVVPIQTGDLLVAQGVLFQSGPIGSGLFVCLWDAQKRQGGVCLNLFIEPLKTSNASNQKMGLFAAPSLPLLVDKMIAGGSERKNITARACGGAQILESPPLLNWAASFPEKVQALFQECGLIPGGLDLGGTKARVVEFNTENGNLLIKSGRQEMQL